MISITGLCEIQKFMPDFTVMPCSQEAEKWWIEGP